MAKLLLGKPVAESILNNIRTEVAKLASKNITPCLVTLRVGNNEADISYERTVLKRAAALGIQTRQFLFEENVTEQALLSAVNEINEDVHIHGCLMFRPLPAHINQSAVCNKLASTKDVDCIANKSLGALFTDAKHRTGFFRPCTAESCMRILDFYNIDVCGKHVVVMGRSLVVGKPVAMLLLRRNATVTICHSKTKDAAAICKAADIVICATGRAKQYGASYFSAGQVVIDVGINFDAAGKLCGDVNFDEVEPVVSAITPVPGGIGTTTTSVTLAHVVESASACTKIKS